MKVIIAGTRTIEDPAVIEIAINASGWRDLIMEVVVGGAKGVDHNAELWAARNNIPFTVFNADWRAHGKAAGPIRNSKMAEYADALIAVWDGVSKGTEDMIRKMRAKGSPAYVWRIEWKLEGSETA